MPRWGWAGALALAVVAMPAHAADGVPPGLQRFVAGLHRQGGDVAVPAANATLHLGRSYYMIPADEAKRVITDVWGNPPSAAEGVLGIVMPADATVLDNVWGAVLTYDDSGYVTDKDADTADYSKVLDDLRQGEAANNEERKKNGFPSIHLVGWAQPPSYDRASHSMVWARDVQFGDSKVDALNYDVRVLGRRGVLSMNMLSSMPQLADVRAAAAAFGRTASFNPGATYGEFDGKVDKAAGYGLAGLVAAGVGLAAVKKFGLLALILAFGKKALVLLAVLGAGVSRFFKKMFRRGGDDGAAGQPGVDGEADATGSTSG